MTLRFRLQSVTSNTGDYIEPLAVGVTCIVGGNNAGKSQLLRDVFQYLEGPDVNRMVVLREISIIRPNPDDPTEVEAWLAKNAASYSMGQGTPLQYTSFTGGSQLRLVDFIQHLSLQPSNSLHATTPFFCWYASAGSLTGFASGSAPLGLLAPGAHPLSRLLRYGELEEELSSLSQEVFGLPLVLDRVTGEVRLRVGDPGVAVPPLNRPTREYSDAVARLKPLEQQGDGIKAFMGLALNIVAGATQLLLVDEPEAFLHPAQARALGRWVASEAKARDKQVILATHDRDLVLGLLDSGADVKMVRVRRESDDRNSLQELSETDLSEVWSDPVLRYSNVLQGLFHERVVICEGDADCRFYSAVLDGLAGDVVGRSVVDSTLFVPSAGKQRMAVLAESLCALGVEVHAFPDFDLLRDRRDVKALLEALGGMWTSQIETAYMAVVRSVRGPEEWERLKHLGLVGLSSGPVHEAGERLLDLLKTSRLHVVRDGEMEDFDRNIGLHGSAWVTAALDRRLHLSSTDARRFVAGIAAGASLEVAT